MGKVLNEQNYQKMKKKIIILAVALLVIGVVLTAVLISLGVSKKNEVAKIDYDSQIELLEDEISDLQEQVNDEFMTNGPSDTYKELNKQQSKKNNELDKLNQSKIKSKMAIVGYYIGGGVVFVAFISGAISLLVTAHRRDISAFVIQSAKPLVNETVDEVVAPTLEKVVKSVSRGISGGVTEGKARKNSKSKSKQNSKTTTKVDSEAEVDSEADVDSETEADE